MLKGGGSRVFMYLGLITCEKKKVLDERRSHDSSEIGTRLIRD